MATGKFRTTRGQYSILLDWIKKRKRAMCRHSPISDLWLWLQRDQCAFPAVTDYTLQIGAKVNPSSLKLLLLGYFYDRNRTSVQGRGKGTQVPKERICCAHCRPSLLRVSWVWPSGADWVLGRSRAHTAFSVSHGDIIQHPVPTLTWDRHWKLTVAARVALSLFPRLGWRPSPSTALTLGWSVCKFQDVSFSS